MMLLFASMTSSPYSSTIRSYSSRTLPWNSRKLSTGLTLHPRSMPASYNLSLTRRAKDVARDTREALPGVYAPRQAHAGFVELELDAPRHEPVERNFDRYPEI